MYLQQLTLYTLCYIPSSNQIHEYVATCPESDLVGPIPTLPQC